MDDRCVVKRYDDIDCAKCIAIFLLLVEHIGNFTTLAGGGYPQLKTWICSFHMPLFFILFGMVSGRKVPKNFHQWQNFLERRSMALLVPYFLWCLIYATRFDKSFFAGVLWGTNSSLAMAGTNSVLWFLPTMFAASVLFMLTVCIEEYAQNVLHRKWVKVIAVFLEITAFASLSLLCGKLFPMNTLRLIFGLDIAFSAVALMLLGYHVIRPVFEWIRQSSKLVAVIFALICLMAGFVAAQMNAPTSPYPVTVMAIALYGKSYLAFVAIAILSTIGILCLCRIICNRFMAWLGQGSMVIMAAHYIVFPFTQSWSQQLLNKLFSGLTCYEILFSVCNGVMTVGLLVPLIYLVNRYVPQLAGKGKLSK